MNKKQSLRALLQKSWHVIFLTIMCGGFLWGTLDGMRELWFMRGRNMVKSHVVERQKRDEPFDVCTLFQNWNGTVWSAATQLSTDVVTGSTYGLSTNYQDGGRSILITYQTGSSPYTIKVKELFFGVARVTLIEQSTVNWVTQRKTVQDQNLWWLWYGDGTGISQATSIDAETWVNQTQIIANVYFGGYFTVALAANHKIHFAYAEDYVPNYPVYYRKGTLQPNGTVTWDAAAQTAVIANATYGHYDMAMVIDSLSQPWVIYHDLKSDSSIGYPMVTRSTSTDGTWTTDTANGFPYSLYPESPAGDTVQNHYATTIQTLSGGRTYCIYGNKVAAQVMHGKMWTEGSGWGAQETVSTTTILSEIAVCSAADSSDNIHIVYVTGSSAPYTIKYANRTTSWNAESDFATDAAATTAPTISASGISIYVKWFEQNSRLVSKIYNGTTWSGETMLDNTIFDGLKRLDDIGATSVTLPNIVYDILAYSIYTGRGAPFVICYYSNSILSTTLTVGWNDYPASGTDVGHTLGEVATSLNTDSINWTTVVLYYANGSSYPFVNGLTYNTAVTVTGTDNTFYIYCGTAGTWTHKYS